MRKIEFGFEVHAYGLGELTEVVNQVEDSAINALLEEYRATYRIAPEIFETPEQLEILKNEARLELGMENLPARAWLHGIRQHV